MMYNEFMDRDPRYVEARRQLYGPPRRTRIPAHIRMQSTATTASNVTTDSELDRRELLLVPPPLTLTPKVYQPPQFSSREVRHVRPRTQHHQILRKTDRYSRLREMSNAQEENEHEKERSQAAYADEDYTAYTESLAEIEALQRANDAKKSAQVGSVSDQNSDKWGSQTYSSDEEQYSNFHGQKYEKSYHAYRTPVKQDNSIIENKVDHAFSAENNSDDDARAENSLPLETLTNKVYVPPSESPIEKYVREHMPKASFTDEEYENYYGDSAIDSETDYEDTIERDHLKNGDKARVCTPVQAGGMSLHGTDSVTSVPSSLAADIGGWNFDQRSANPIHSMDATTNDRRRFQPFLRPDSSESVSPNRYQAAWDLKMGHRNDTKVDAPYEKELQRLKTLRVLEHGDVGQGAEPVVFANRSQASIVDAEEAVTDQNMPPPEIPKPLTFREIQALQEASKVLRDHGQEQNFKNFLAATGIGALAAPTCDELGKLYGHPIRSHMRKTSPGEYGPVAEARSVGGNEVQNFGASHSTSLPIPSNGRQHIPFASQAVPNVAFAPPSFAPKKSSAQESEMKFRSLRNKISIREGLSNLFSAGAKRPTSADKQQKGNNQEMRGNRDTGNDEERQNLLARSDIEDEVNQPSGSRIQDSNGGANQARKAEGTTRGSRRDHIINVLGGLV